MRGMKNPIVSGGIAGVAASLLAGVVPGGLGGPVATLGVGVAMKDATLQTLGGYGLGQMLASGGLGLGGGNGGNGTANILG